MSNQLGMWIESSRIEGKLYCNDSVDKLKGVGKKMSDKVEEIELKQLTTLKYFQI